MCMNATNSRVVRRAAPSATFEGMDTAARRICELRPKISCRGMVLVSRWIAAARLMAFCQRIKSL